MRGKGPQAEEPPQPQPRSRQGEMRERGRALQHLRIWTKHNAHIHSVRTAKEGRCKRPCCTTNTPACQLKDDPHLSVPTRHCCELRREGEACLEFMRGDKRHSCRAGGRRRTICVHTLNEGEKWCALPVQQYITCSPLMGSTEWSRAHRRNV